MDLLHSTKQQNWLWTVSNDKMYRVDFHKLTNVTIHNKAFRETTSSLNFTSMTNHLSLSDLPYLNSIELGDEVFYKASSLNIRIISVFLWQIENCNLVSFVVGMNSFRETTSLVIDSLYKWLFSSRCSWVESSFFWTEFILYDKYIESHQFDYSWLLIRYSSTYSHYIQFKFIL